jgi:hypothetical protein
MKEFLPIIKDIILILTALTGAIVAARGLSAWKRQLSGKAEYELAQRLLKATYKLREAIRVVRNPVMFSGEMPEPPEDHPAAESDAKKRWYGVTQAYEKRWESVRNAHVDIEAELLEAEVLWGRHIREKFLSLFEVENDLFINILAYFDHLDPDIHESRTPEEARANRLILYGVGGLNDALHKRLQESIATIENELKPHLKRYG